MRSLLAGPGRYIRVQANVSGAALLSIGSGEVYTPQSNSLSRIALRFPDIESPVLVLKASSH